MLARGHLCRLVAGAPKTSTHDLPVLAHLLQRTFLSTNVAHFSALRAVPRAYSAVFTEKRSYATATKAAPTKTVKRAPRKSAAEKQAAEEAKKAAAAAKKAAREAKKAAAAEQKVEKAKQAKLMAEERGKQKDQELIKKLKALALVEPVPHRDVQAWNLYFGEARGKGPVDKERSLRTEFANLSAAEREHYNHIASERTAENKKQLDEWVRSHTIAEIMTANKARSRLRRLFRSKGKAPPKHTMQIQDDRLPKHPLNVYTEFVQERYASGDFKGISFTEAAKLLGSEFRALSASEKQKYKDGASASMAEYTREMKSLA